MVDPWPCRAGKGSLPLAPTTGSSSNLLEPDEEALDLLSTLGSVLRRPQQPAASPAVASPLLSSPAKSGLAPSTDQQQAAVQHLQQQHEEEAVKAFLKKLPPKGVGRHELVQQLLRTLGTASGAAQLAPPVRLQLLQVVHHVQHDGLQLAAQQCLLLGELFTDAVAAAARGSTHGSGTAAAAAGQAVGGGGAGSPAGVRPGNSLIKRPGSMRSRRAELTSAMLQQAARLWLSRFRLAAVEAAGQPESVADQLREAAHGLALPSAELLEGMARYWWATGRLLECTGDMPAASSAYAHCQDSLKLLGTCMLFDVSFWHGQMLFCTSRGLSTVWVCSTPAAGRLAQCVLFCALCHKQRARVCL